MSRSTPNGTVPKPSAKQVYCLLHVTLDLLGLDWPSDRKSASELIARLMEHKSAVSADAGMAF